MVRVRRGLDRGGCSFPAAKWRGEVASLQGDVYAGPWEVGPQVGRTVQKEGIIEDEQGMLWPERRSVGSRGAGCGGATEAVKSDGAGGPGGSHRPPRLCLPTGGSNGSFHKPVPSVTEREACLGV